MEGRRGKEIHRGWRDGGGRRYIEGGGTEGRETHRRVEG